MVDRIAASQPAAGTLAVAGARALQQTQKESGAPLTAMPSASQLLQDMQEEISFSHSEKTEEKDIAEHDCEDYLDAIYAQLIADVAQEYPAEDPSHKGKYEETVSLLRRSGGQNPDQLRGALRDITADSGEAFALLARAEKDPSLTQEQRVLAHTAARAMAEDEAPAIQAGINTAGLARAAAETSGLPADQLQAAYQSMVVDYGAILPALTHMAEKGGASGFAESARFLTSAAAADLSSVRPSAQPARLQHILARFQGVKIFNSLREGSDAITGRFDKEVSAAPAFAKGGFFVRYLKFLTRPEEFASLLYQPMTPMGKARKTLMLQDIRTNARSVPLWLLPEGAAARSRIIYPLQKEIDRLVYEEGA